MVLTVQRATTFLFGKLLGNASDVHGRKPLLAGALLGYGCTAIMLFIGLKTVEYVPFLIGGIMLGISAPLSPHAIAAIADVSSSTDLPKNMSYFQGLGIQLGLLFGSVVALTIIVAHDSTKEEDGISNVDANFNMLSTSFIVSIAMGMSGVVIIGLFLRETLHKDERGAMDWKSANPLSGIAVIFKSRYLLCAGILVFVMSFGLAASEATFLNWMVTRFSLYKWKRSETFCPPTYVALTESLKFNVSDADTEASGFRCCSWDADLHGHEWSTADWGSPGAAFMAPGSANGPLSGAADRGSFLAPTLVREDGVSCMGTPGDYSTCAGFSEAVTSATAAATAEAAPGEPLFNEAYALTAAPSGELFVAAFTAYATGGGTMTGAEVATCGGTATDTSATPDCAAAFSAAADTTDASCPAGCTYVEGFAEVITPFITTELTTKITALITARVGALVPSHWTEKKMFGSKCGDPNLTDEEVCPELGFPICVPDGVDLGRVMSFLLPLLLCSGVGQAITMSFLPKMLGFKMAVGFLMVWGCFSNTMIAFLPTLASFYIYVAVNAIGASLQPAVVTLFIGQADAGEKGAVAGSYRTLEAGGKALGSLIMGTIYMAAYFREYPAQGLKWGETGVMNFDTDMNVIGGGLLDNGAMCQPAGTLLGAMNPYKTQVGATALAMASAGTFQADATALAAAPSGELFVAAFTAYATGGGTMTGAEVATCGGTATDTSATPDCAAAFSAAADTTDASCPAGCTYAEGFAEVITPFITDAVTLRTTELITAEVVRLIGECKPTASGNSAAEYCKYDFMPDVQDSGSCALAKTYDMFADPEFPGIVLLVTAIPNYIMLLLYVVMECTPSIKGSCKLDASEEAVAKVDEAATAP